MFITFFTELKSAGIPVSLREYLTLMEALDKDLAERSVEDFYYLARLSLVKDESNLDKFDRVFGHVFKGLELMRRRADDRHSGRMAAQACRKTPIGRRQGPDRGPWRFRKADGNPARAAEGTGKNATRAATSGSARPAPPPSGLMATIRKACASARRKAGTGARSRSGTSASSRILTTPSFWEPATSRWRSSA